MIQIVTAPPAGMTALLSQLIPAVLALGGVALGGWIAALNDQHRRRAEFIGRQLSEFYGPMLALRREISARSDSRVRIEDAADHAWRALVEHAQNIGGDAVEALQSNRFHEFSGIIEHNNAQFENLMVPAYREMLRLFREKLSLAEPATLNFYVELVSFVDVWERRLAGSMPIEVARSLGHSEQNLHQSYGHLETTHIRLRQALASA